MTLPPSRFGAGFTVGDAPDRRPDPAAYTVPSPARPSTPLPVSPGAAPTAVNAMNPLAVLSFVSVLLLGPLVVAVSIPMALIARAQINSRGQSGAGLVIATLALSVIYLAFGVVVLLLLLYTQAADSAP